MAKLKMYANKYGIPVGFIAAVLIAAYHSETDSGKDVTPLAQVVEQVGGPVRRMVSAARSRRTRSLTGIDAALLEELPASSKGVTGIEAALLEDDLES